MLKNIAHTRASYHICRLTIIGGLLFQTSIDPHSASALGISQLTTEDQIHQANFVELSASSQRIGVQQTDPTQPLTSTTTNDIATGKSNKLYLPIVQRDGSPSELDATLTPAPEIEPTPTLTPTEPITDIRRAINSDPTAVDVFDNAIKVGAPEAWKMNPALGSVSSFRGSANYGYAIDVPGTLDDLQPSLNIDYSSASSDMDTNGHLGHGWDMNLSKISRVYSIDSYSRWVPEFVSIALWDYYFPNAGGNPNWCTPDHSEFHQDPLTTTVSGFCGPLWRHVGSAFAKLDFGGIPSYTLNLNGQTHQLIHKGGGEYVTRDYSLMRIRQCNATYPCTGSLAMVNDTSGKFNTEYWQVWTPDGTRYSFGVDAQSEQVIKTPINSPDSPDEDSAVAWYLRRVYANHRDSADAANHKFTTEYAYTKDHENTGLVDWDKDVRLTAVTYGDSTKSGRYQVTIGYQGSGETRRINNFKTWIVGQATPLKETRFIYYTSGDFKDDLQAIQTWVSNQTLPETSFEYQKIDGKVMLYGVNNGYGGRTQYAYQIVPSATISQHRVASESTLVNISGVTSTTGLRTFEYGTVICEEKVGTSCYSGYAIRESKALVGHDQVTEVARDPNNIELAVSKSKFHLDLPRIGRMYEGEQMEATTRVIHSRSQTEFTVFTATMVGGSGLPTNTWFTVATTQTTYPNVSVPSLVNRSTTIYTGTGAWVDGVFIAQALSTNEWGTATPGVGTPFRHQESEFTFDASKYLLLPTRSRSYDGATLVTEVTNYYDGSVTLGDIPDKGDQTKAVYTTNLPTPKTTSIQFLYNASGQPISQSLESRTALIQYDTTFGTFVTQVTDAVGTTQQQVKTYEYYGLNEGNTGEGSGPFGALKASTDPNNATMRYAYDVFGRLTSLVQPGDSFANPTQITQYGDTASPQVIKPLRVTAWQREVSGCAGCVHPTYSFYDGLGHALQTKTETQNGNQVIVAHTAYDALGRKIFESVPDFLNGTGTTFDGYTAPDWGNLKKTQTLYDGLGRTIVITGADGQASRTIYQETTEGMSTASIDANGHQRAQFSDVFGRLIRVQEFTGTLSQPSFSGDVYATTQYGYDGRDNLTVVTDTLGNTTVITYDGYGRKTDMDDPDMGRWFYTYDTLSNLQTQRDANNQMLWFKYDVLNRLLEKRVGDANGALLASFEYDQGANAKGRRTKAIGYVNGTSYVTRNWVYDIRGRVTQETAQVEGKTFIFDYTYDAADRMTTMTYPEDEYGVRETVTTQFDDAMRPITMTSNMNGAVPYVSGLTYNALGQAQKTTLGNLFTRWQGFYGLDIPGQANYGRLYQTCVSLSASASCIGIGNASLFKLEFGYDNVGNITSWQDKTTGRETTMSFGYDPLDRLISANTSAGADPINEAYGFDPIGNLTQKGNVTQSYSANSDVRPHAVNARSDGGSFVHDPNGNMTLRAEVSGTQVITYAQGWDIENRLIAVTDTVNGYVTQYTYDADGKRIAKLDPDGLTLYIADGYEWYSTTLPVAGVAPTATLAADGDYAGLRIRQRGDYGVITFTAQAGQHFSLFGEDQYGTLPDFWVHTPSGTEITHTTTTQNGPDFVVDSATGAYYGLPETGNYTITVKPQDNRRGRYRWLLSSPVLITSSLPMQTLAKATHQVDITRPAQDGLITFNGVAGRDIAIDLNSATGPVELHLYRPDGSELISTLDPLGIEVALLDVTGTYTLRLNPLNNATGSFIVTLLVLVPIRPATIAAGRAHACRITPDKVVHCWGDNAYDKLGIANVTGSAIPLTVTLPISNIKNVSAGNRASCAIDKLGNHICWGSIPAQFWEPNVPNEAIGLVNAIHPRSGYADVTHGDLYACLLTRRGAVKCAGINYSWSQLGDGTSNFWYWYYPAPGTNCPTFAFGNETCSNLPINVIGLQENVIAIDAGYRHSCAVLKDGGMKCWGDGSAGELGNQAQTVMSVPVTVTNLAGPVADVMAGFDNTCALLQSGAVQCWGYEWALGDGRFNPGIALIPVNAINLNGSITQISMLHDHACAANAQGGVQCWGQNDTLGTGGSVRTPMRVVGLGESGATYISADDDFSCATLSNGSFTCWGNNTSFGVLGDGSTLKRDVPNVSSVSAAILLDPFGSPSIGLVPQISSSAIFTFEGVQGQGFHLAIAGQQATNGHTGQVYGPDARLLSEFTVNSNYDPITNRDWVSLPLTGRYTLQLMPPSPLTQTYSVTASLPVTDAIAVDGLNTIVTITRTGQDAILTFAGQVGQRLSVGLDATGADAPNYYVYKPDGTELDSFVAYGSNTGISDLDLPMLPISGTYTLRVHPYHFGTGRYTITVSSPAVADLSIDGSAVLVVIGRAGQDARLGFTGQQSQVVTLTVFAASTTSAKVYVYKPDGAVLSTANGNTVSSGVLATLGLGTLPVSGTYTLLIDPTNGGTGTFTATLFSAASAPQVPYIDINGATYITSVATPGQTIELAFTGTLSALLNLAVNTDPAPI
jgi:YD repeat-containing protein